MAESRKQHKEEQDTEGSAIVLPAELAYEISRKAAEEAATAAIQAANMNNDRRRSNSSDDDTDYVDNKVLKQVQNIATLFNAVKEFTSNPLQSTIEKKVGDLAATVVENAFFPRQSAPAKRDMIDSILNSQFALGFGSSLGQRTPEIIETLTRNFGREKASQIIDGMVNRGSIGGPGNDMGLNPDNISSGNQSKEQSNIDMLLALDPNNPEHVAAYSESQGDVPIDVARKMMMIHQDAIIKKMKERGNPVPSDIDRKNSEQQAERMTKEPLREYPKTQRHEEIPNSENLKSSNVDDDAIQTVLSLDPNNSDDLSSYADSLGGISLDLAKQMLIVHQADLKNKLEQARGRRNVFSQQTGQQNDQFGQNAQKISVLEDAVKRVPPQHEQKSNVKYDDITEDHEDVDLKKDVEKENAENFQLQFMKTFAEEIGKAIGGMTTKIESLNNTVYTLQNEFTEYKNKPAVQDINNTVREIEENIPIMDNVDRITPIVDKIILSPQRSVQDIYLPDSNIQIIENENENDKILDDKQIKQERHDSQFSDISDQKGIEGLPISIPTKSMESLDVVEPKRDIFIPNINISKQDSTINKIDLSPNIGNTNITKEIDENMSASKDIYDNFVDQNEEIDDQQLNVTQEIFEKEDSHEKIEEIEDIKHIPMDSEEISDIDEKKTIPIRNIHVPGSIMETPTIIGIIQPMDINDKYIDYSHDTQDTQQLILPDQQMEELDKHVTTTEDIQEISISKNVPEQEIDDENLQENIQIPDIVDKNIDIETEDKVTEEEIKIIGNESIIDEQKNTEDKLKISSVDGIEELVNKDISTISPNEEIITSEIENIVDDTNKYDDILEAKESDIIPMITELDKVSGFLVKDSEEDINIIEEKITSDKVRKRVTPIRKSNIHEKIKPSFKKKE